LIAAVTHAAAMWSWICLIGAHGEGPAGDVRGLPAGRGAVVVKSDETVPEGARDAADRSP
jgi:hypothetical protein